MTRFNLILPLTLTMLILVPAASAQGKDAQPLPYQTGDPAGWPPELDAVVAAPDNHTVLMENDQVRVLEVILDTREMDGPLPLPLTMWKDPEAPHSVENLSSTQRIRLLRIELKQEGR